MNAENTKVEVLDSLRGFAAISVCLFHFVCTITGYIQTDWILKLFSVGQYGVQMFFVISGFVIPWSMFHARYEIKNFFSFFLKRISRLEPPYLFSILLAIIVLYLRENFLGRSNDHIQLSLKQVALHLGYLIPFFDGYKWLNQVYWTLAIEFQYYLLIAFIYIPLIKFGLVTRLLIYVILVSSCFFGTEAFLPHWLPVFLLGIITFLFKAKIISNYEYYIATPIIILVCVLSYPMASVLFSFIPLVFLIYWQDVKIVVLHFLGKFSYSIYLIHPIIGASLINILSHHFNSPLTKLLVILSGLIVTLLSAWLTYIVVEKPSKKLSASISYTNKRNWITKQ